MRFEVKRTSLWDDEQPCPEAVLEMVPEWDRRTFKSAEEHDALLCPRSAPWLSRGTEHRTMYGPRGGVVGIERRVDDRAGWFIELGSLEDMMEFVGKYGTVVLTEEPSIEIYDDYRE